MFPEGFYSCKIGNNLYKRLCSCLPWRAHRPLRGPTPRRPQRLACPPAGHSSCHSAPPLSSRSFRCSALVFPRRCPLHAPSPACAALRLLPFPRARLGMGRLADDCHMAHTSWPKVDVITAQHFLSRPFLPFHHVYFFHLRPVLQVMGLYLARLTSSAISHSCLLTQL